MNEVIKQFNQFLKDVDNKVYILNSDDEFREDLENNNHNSNINISENKEENSKLYSYIIKYLSNLERLIQIIEENKQNLESIIKIKQFQ